MTEEQVREFLRVYSAGAAQALDVAPERIHIKGGDAKDGVILALTIDGESATREQLAQVKAFFEATERMH